MRLTNPAICVTDLEAKSLYVWFPVCFERVANSRESLRGAKTKIMTGKAVDTLFQPLRYSTEGIKNSW